LKRRVVLTLAVGLLVAPSMLPQETSQGSQTSREAEQGDPWIWWKWANFLILAGGLGYLISKSAPAFFEGRSKEILQGIEDGAKALQAAQARAAAVELRLAGIPKEIDRLRSDARTELAAESQRIQGETARHIQKLQQQATQEITLMTRASRAELRRYSADLALQLAEQRIRSRMTAETQNGLLDGFLNDLRRETGGGVRA
jgi:F-type H+-transporting ATPase subunit b